MFRLWGITQSGNKTIHNEVFEIDNPSLSKMEKTNQGIEHLSYQFDIQKPMWFSDNDKDFAQFGKTRFTQQHFIESIDFDYFEIEIIEDDDKEFI